MREMKSMRLFSAAALDKTLLSQAGLAPTPTLPPSLLPPPCPP